MKRLLAMTAVLAMVGAPAAAQMPRTAAPLTRAAATITGSDVARRVTIIAHDSMLGRDTPSRGLEMTAQYVADEFKRFGLKPGGENGTYFQRYPIITAKLDMAASHVGFMTGGNSVHVTFDRAARWRGGSAPKGELSGGALLVGGTLDPAGLDASQAKDKFVVVVMDYTRQVPPTAQAVSEAFTKAGAAGFIIVSNRDTAVFARSVAAQRRAQPRLGGSTDESPAVVEVHEQALADIIPPATLAELRASPTLVVRPLPDLQVMLEVKRDDKEQTAPNTIGILEGSDPKLKAEYIVYSAHMDHVGVNPPRKGTTDSIWNGADDDASGTVGIVELAEAFAQKGARPRRSVIFMTVSGEEKGLWGSRWFSEHPTVPIGSIVADFNMDMIGRNWQDTIVVIGKEHSDLGATLNRVNAAHPELRMTAIDDIWPQERFYFRSDHYNFARKGVPILFFFNGTHEDYHGAGDSPDKIEAEKESRILKLAFYLGQVVANTTPRPAWKPESYKEIVEGPGGRR